MSPHFRILKLALSLAIVLMVVALSAGQDGSVSTNRSVSVNKTPYVRTGHEATLTGTIKLSGKRQNSKRIDMSADVVCYQVNPDPKTEDIVGTKGKLANVLVFVKGMSLDSYSFESPTSAGVLEHRGCRYVPRVLAVQVGQSLTIFNRDPTYHNTHALPGENQEWNQSQAPGSPPIKSRFDQPDYITFRDNQHPWEKAIVGVFAHPFFAVSDDSGNYRIEGLPPGQYTVVVRHETMGEKTAEVTLVAGEEKELSFTFGAAGN